MLPFATLLQSSSSTTLREQIRLRQEQLNQKGSLAHRLTLQNELILLTQKLKDISYVQTERASYFAYPGLV